MKFTIGCVVKELTRLRIIPKVIRKNLQAGANISWALAHTLNNCTADRTSQGRRASISSLNFPTGAFHSGEGEGDPTRSSVQHRRNRRCLPWDFFTHYLRHHRADLFYHMQQIIPAKK